MQVLLKCVGGVKMASFWVNFAQYLEIVSLIHSSSFLLTAEQVHCSPKGAKVPTSNVCMI